MKVYRNLHTPKVIGVKFDNLRNSMVTIAADGDIDTAATIEFVARDREVVGDLNADPDFMKDYNADMRQIFADMLGACDVDMSARFKLEHDCSGESVCVSKAEDGDIDGFDALTERLMSLIRILA
jgi:hypothetical protein